MKYLGNDDQNERDDNKEDERSPEFVSRFEESAEEYPVKKWRKQAAYRKEMPDLRSSWDL